MLRNFSPSLPLTAGLFLTISCAQAEVPGNTNNTLHPLITAQVSTATPQQSQPAPTPEKKLFDRKSLLSRAGELSKNGRSKEAYQLLSPYQSALAGDAEFDYLFGIAALDVGKINEAIFALERVLAVNPKHLQARAEIAQAYLAAGEVSASKQEFEIVQKQNPPLEVSERIKKYLAIIETGESEQKTAIQGYIEYMLGEDSNINTATSNRQVAIPLFGGAILDMNNAGIANHDTFNIVGAGLNVRHTLNPDWSVLGGANISQRTHTSQNAYDNGSGDINLGLSANKGDNNYIVLLQAQGFNLDRKRYRDANGFTAQWQRNLSSTSQFSSFLQYSALSYPEQPNNDAKRYVLGVGYATAYGKESSLIVYTSLYGGKETVLISDTSPLGYAFYGARIGSETKLSTANTLLLSASIESRQYDGVSPLFLVKRDDSQGDFKIGINYTPVKNWIITPSYSYTNNSSNVAINKYDRTVYSLNIRRNFN